MIEDADYMELSANREKLLVRKGNDYAIIENMVMPLRVIRPWAGVAAQARSRRSSARNAPSSPAPVSLRKSRREKEPFKTGISWILSDLWDCTSNEKESLIQFLEAGRK